MSTKHNFSAIDYAVFTLTLLSSLGIGLYHCIRGNKSTEDFLLASRSMSPLPVALSLTATFVSSISILGNVGEVYGNGIQLAWSLVGMCIGMLVATNVFMPMMYALRLSSTNEYLELRFRSPLLKRCVLAQATVTMLLYLGVCLFAPTMALESVTPYSSGTYIVILGGVVTLYSSFGGLKAVVWTDAVQTVIIIISVLVATVAAIVQAGGLGQVWAIASAHGRTAGLTTGFGLHQRHTIFNTMLMYSVNFTYIYSFNQNTIQRVGTMPNISKVKLVLFLNGFFLLSLLGLLFFTGLCIFAVYADCDPITLGLVGRKDQMFPYYVVERLGFMKGVPGLFVACLFSGTMSSISSTMNSLPTMLWTDFFSKMPFFMKSSEAFKTATNKFVTFVLGICMIGMAFMSSKMGGLVQATSTLMSIMTGPTIGVFLLGACAPICGAKGALAGFWTSVVFMAWLGIGAQYHGMQITLLPLSTSQCVNETMSSVLSNITSSTSGLVGSSSTVAAVLTSTLEPVLTHHESSEHPLAGFYGISYTFLSPIGCFLCITVALIVSVTIAREDMECVEPRLVLPCCRRFVGPRPQLHHAQLKPFLGDNLLVTANGTSLPTSKL